MSVGGHQFLMGRSIDTHDIIFWGLGGRQFNGAGITTDVVTRGIVSGSRSCHKSRFVSHKFAKSDVVTRVLIVFESQGESFESSTQKHTNP